MPFGGAPKGDLLYVLQSLLLQHQRDRRSLRPQAEGLGQDETAPADTALEEGLGEVEAARAAVVVESQHLLLWAAGAREALAQLSPVSLARLPSRRRPVRA